MFTSSARTNWFACTYFHRLIFYYRLITSLLTPPIEKVRPLPRAVPDGPDKPVTQVTATPLPAVCGDPRGSRPRHSRSSYDWTAERASGPRMEHLHVNHRRCPEWSDVWRAENTHSNADEGGQRRGDLTAFLQQPGGSGAARVGEEPDSTGRTSPQRPTEGGHTRTGSEAAPGRISGAVKTPQPH